MFPILAAIQDRLQARLIQFVQPNQQTEKIVYRQPQNKTQKVPFFGSSQGFGMDYVQTKSVQVSPVGYQPGVTSSPIKSNFQGYVKGWKPNPELPVAYVDPATSRRFKQRYGGTDQRPVASKRSSGCSWDGVVRSDKKNKSFESNRRPKEETYRDRLTKEMEKEPYSFFQ